MRSIAVFLLLIALSAIVTAQVKKPESPAAKVPFTQSLQAVVVTTKGWDLVSGTATLYERKNATSDWKAFGESFPVVVGRNGLAWAELVTGDIDMAKIKREGDGNAPAGLFPLTASFGSGSKPNAVELPYTKLDKFTECVDDTKSNHYNRIVNRMHVGSFDWKSSEKMLAVGEQYALGIFVAYNTYPVEKGRGSCIFLHIWKDANSGTAGCTAMERRNLERIVAWASPKKNPYLVQMPKDIYEKGPKIVETTKTQITLDQLSVGSRLLVRSRVDWRFAAVSRIAEERVVLTVCSPTGRTYRLRREANAAILINGQIPVLISDYKDDWRNNFGRYDHRW